MTEQDLKRLRKKYIISPRFQWELTGYFMSASVFALATLFWGIHRSLNSMGDRCKVLAGNQNLICVDLITLYQRDVRFLFLAVSVIILVFLLLGGILVSHRIAGPIYRLSQVIRQIGEGQKVNQFHFREHDYFKELADSFNQNVLPKIDYDKK